MGDMKGMFDAMLALARTVAPAIGHGVPQAIEIGDKVVEMIDHATHEFAGNVPPELTAERDVIDEKIRQHVASTSSKLRGNQSDQDRSGKN